MITSYGTLTIQSIQAVRATAEPGVFIVSAIIADHTGQAELCNYVSRPDDQHGLNPGIRAWLASNSYEILPHGEVN